MKFLFTCLALVLSLQLRAEEIKMAIITSEFDQNVTDYFLETNDQNQITGMRYITKLPNGGIFEDVSVPAERVITDGVVMVERNGFQAVRLEVENFNLQSGGILKMNYLFSGVTGTRRIKRLTLKLVDNKFQILDLENNRVNRMFLKANWVRVFGIVGISEVITSLVE